jgi:hypothetical protein
VRVVLKLLRANVVAWKGLREAKAAVQMKRRYCAAFLFGDTVVREEGKTSKGL